MKAIHLKQNIRGTVLVVPFPIARGCGVKGARPRHVFTNTDAINAKYIIQVDATSYAVVKAELAVSLPREGDISQLSDLLAECYSLVQMESRLSAAVKEVASDAKSAAANGTSSCN